MNGVHAVTISCIDRMIRPSTRPCAFDTMDTPNTPHGSPHGVDHAFIGPYAVNAEKKNTAVKSLKVLKKLTCRQKYWHPDSNLSKIQIYAFGY